MRRPAGSGTRREAGVYFVVCREGEGSRSRPEPWIFERAHSTSPAPFSAPMLRSTAPPLAKTLFAIFVLSGACASHRRRVIISVVGCYTHSLDQHGPYFIRASISASITKTTSPDPRLSYRRASSSRSSHPQCAQNAHNR